MKHLIRLFLALLFVSFISSCKKDDEPMSVVPAITFKSISPSTVNQFSDSLVIAIEYTDGDADLGQNNTETPNAFVTDQRNNIEYKFRIRQLAPDNANIAIKGVLDIIIPSVAVSGTTSELATFSLYVKDRAGNQSNTIATTAITVNP